MFDQSFLAVGRVLELGLTSFVTNLLDEFWMDHNKIFGTLPTLYGQFSKLGEDTTLQGFPCAVRNSYLVLVRRVCGLLQRIDRDDSYRIWSHDQNQCVQTVISSVVSVFANVLSAKLELDDNRLTGTIPSELGVPILLGAYVGVVV